MFCEKGKVEKISSRLGGDVKRCVAEVRPTEVKYDPQKVEAQPEQKKDLGQLLDNFRREIWQFIRENERTIKKLKGEP